MRSDPVVSAQGARSVAAAGRQSTLRGVYSVYPACGGFAVMAVALTVIQRFWLDINSPRWLLAVWLGTHSSARLAAGVAAKSRVLTMVIASVAMACLASGALAVQWSGQAVWLFAASGLVDPLGTMILRLRDEGLPPKRFDEYARLSHSCYLRGVLCAGACGWLAQVVGVWSVATLACMASGVVVAAHCSFGIDAGDPVVEWWRQLRPNWRPTSTWRPTQAGINEGSVLSPRAAFRTMRRTQSRGGTLQLSELWTTTTGSASNVPGLLRLETSTVRRFGGVPSDDGVTMSLEDDDDEWPCPGDEERSIEQEDIAVTPTLLFRLSRSLMTGIGFAETVIFSCGALYFADRRAWVYTAVACAMLGLAVVAEYALRVLEVSCTPKNVVVVLSGATCACGLVVAVPNVDVVTAAVLMFLVPALHFAQRASARIIESYSPREHATTVTVAYAAGAVAASLIAPIVFFEAGPAVLFLVELCVCSLVAARVAWLFITSAVEQGNKHFSHLTDVQLCV